MGTIVPFLIAAVVATTVTSLQLWRGYHRGPLGDEKQLALRWWAFVIAVDAAVAAGLTLGVFTVNGLDDLDIGGVVRPIAVGILGPLALRSPVRRTRVRGKTAEVGFTYVYDYCRITGLRALDDRIADLRREDRKTLVGRVTGLSWDSISMRGRIENHLDNLPNWDVEDLADIRRKLRAQMTATEDARVDGLLNILQEEGLTGLIDGMCRSGEDPSDHDRGQAALQQDVQVAPESADSADLTADAVKEAAP